MLGLLNASLGCRRINLHFSRGISGKPLIQLLHKYLGLSRTIAEAATQTVIVHPEQEIFIEQAFHLDGQLDRVTNVASNSSWELEKQRMASGVKVQGPTLAYRIDHGVFSAGRLYTNRAQEKQGGTQKRKPFCVVTDELDTAVLPLSYFATIYFGHMVFDGGATSLSAPRFGETYIDTAVSKGMTGHVARYWDLFGLSYTAVKDVRIRHAWVFDDRGMNSDKASRLQTMSAKVRMLPGIRSGHGVFMRRRGWGAHRAPENEAELENHFAARGFDIIDPSELSVDEIVASTRDAEVLVGVEGSGMTHGMLAMARGTTIIMMFPPWRLNNMMKDYADGLGLRYGFVVGTGQHNNYRIDPDEILRTIEVARK